LGKQVTNRYEITYLSSHNESKIVTAKGYTYESERYLFLDEDGNTSFLVTHGSVKSIELLPTPDHVSDIRKVLRTLSEVVQEFGEDYVYNRTCSNKFYCKYVTEAGEPDCIAAQVLTRLGVSTAYLAARELKGCNEAVFFDNGVVGKEALNVLREAQMMQDIRNSWGKARDSAFAYARDRYGVTLEN
jgi:hypothetical protein